MEKILDNSKTPRALLDAAYEQLEFNQGVLLAAADQPQADMFDEWLDRGDWQALAAQVGAERVFFVDRDPVIVFAKVDDNKPDTLRKLYEQVWCMSRPQLLFLASPGDLSVYDLTKPPPRPNENLNNQDRLIEVAKSVVEVQSKLAAFHRERIESGAIFGEDRFRNSPNRADRALIRDLKTVRYQLENVHQARGKRPELKHLHSLIGRAIFVRYLEDREVLVPSYFERVASKRKEWKQLLETPPISPTLEPRMKDLLFVRVLQDKNFTYALFEQLAEDFNGDIFPIDEDEQKRIQQAHLDTLRGFLQGNTSSQQDLFFFAYRFDIIPIELISTIYEEFYNKQKGKNQNQGSHYTPPALVEYVLAQALPSHILACKPRVMDPACGSGIFLVESFRRMVRHLWTEQNGKRVSRAQLRKILRDQIVGIDINEEAVRVAAFSLYLAFLHYQEPREINDERKLPYLKWVPEVERQTREKKNPDAAFFDILLHANSFQVVLGKFPIEVVQRFGSNSAAVVVGNPPWGFPKRDDKEGRNALSDTMKWCDADKGRPVGDKELSQSFIHLALELLQDGGRAGLLVSSGIFFKNHQNSRKFRQVWLKSTRLLHVSNFAHVRHVFFAGPQREAKGISPFASVVFEKSQFDPTGDNRFQYWSAKRTAIIENTQCVLLNRGDMHWLSQGECLLYEKLWKIYWWGGHRDELLIRSLENHYKLCELSELFPAATVSPGMGFLEGNKQYTRKWLGEFKELPVESLSRYGPTDLAGLVTVPPRVARRGVREVYEGHRLLIRRGIPTGGQLTVRHETHSFCFRHSVIGFRLQGLESWQEKILTAIFWSSLAQYYFFSTAGSWGMWHDELLTETAGELPLCFPKDNKLKDKIVKLVDELQQIDLRPGGLELGGVEAQKKLPKLECQLNEAIFECYGLNSAERDLIEEMTTLGLDLFYRNQKSGALSPPKRPAKNMGLLGDVKNAEIGLEAYLRVFLEVWNNELDTDSEFAWQIVPPVSSAPLIMVRFITKYKNKPLPKAECSSEWQPILSDLAKDSTLQTNCKRLFIDTFFRHVSDHEILFIKRDEQRFWTRTSAREDAESAFTNLINLEEVSEERKNEFDQPLS